MTSLLPAPRRVLIVKPSALGDVITALPVLRGLRRTFGRSVHVAWLLSRSCAPAVEHEADLDEVVPFDRRGLAAFWRSGLALAGLWRFCRGLRRAGYDWVLDLQGLFRSGFFARATGAAVRAGFATAREGAPAFYTHALPADQTPVHTVDRNIALARSLGIDAREEDFRLSIPPKGLRYAEHFAARYGSRYVVVAPAARWTSKLYPTRHWRAVVRELARRATVALVAAPGEERFTAPLAGAAAEGAGAAVDRPGATAGSAAVVDLAGRTSVPELIGLIAGSAGVVSCDSAAMHIATATGAPQVAILGPTDPARTGPWRRPDSVVQTHLPCRACLRRRCSHGSCMELISPEQVLAAVARNLAL